MQWHHRVFRVDGLNIDANGFSWKDRIIFTNSQLPNKHTATAYVRMKRSLNDPIYRKDIFQHDKDLGESWRLVSLLFACYGLVNKQYMPKIDITGATGFDIIENKSSLGFLPYSIGIESPSTHGTMPVEQTMQCLNNTIPLFEKVITILDGHKKAHKLDVALIMYYRSSLTIESIEELVDRITALEALFSDGKTELAYKIALRTSIFVERDLSKRREIFKFLKDAYEARSKLVHGNDIALELMSKYRAYASGLRFILHNALLNYIELASKGLTKKQIYESIDDTALGLHSKIRYRYEPTTNDYYYDPLF